MVHICEFTADLIQHGRLKLDPSRNDRLRVTFHDSCNPARAMGLLEEPRYVLRAVCHNFFEMPENTIREQTFCCGGGAGLGNDENMEMRLRGGLPRASAVRLVREQHGVNTLACICAIDRAALSSLMDYWVPGRRRRRGARAARQRARHGGREAEDDGPQGPARSRPRRRASMRDGPRIAAGLAALPRPRRSAPVWQRAAAGRGRSEPEPMIVEAAGTRCVGLARGDARDPHARSSTTGATGGRAEGAPRTRPDADGRPVTMSLTGTCLACHPNKKEFCDRCHVRARREARLLGAATSEPEEKT